MVVSINSNNNNDSNIQSLLITRQRMRWALQRSDLRVQTEKLRTQGLLAQVPARSPGRDFPGGPVAKTPHAQCRGPRFHPWSGN